jgi:lanthanide-dependent methanol dehydrogenase
MGDRGQNYASTRYSELDEINTTNVGKLQMAWAFSLGTNKRQEAAPLIVDNVLYVIPTRCSRSM